MPSMDADAETIKKSLRAVMKRIAESDPAKPFTIHVSEDIAERLWWSGCISDDGVMGDFPDEPAIVTDQTTASAPPTDPDS